MRNGTCVKQHDITDCGAACLASVCAYYGLNVPIARVRQYASTDKKGTNVLGLVEAAGKLNLAAKGVRAEFDSIRLIPKPAIAHVIISESLQHYVVIYKVYKKSIIYMDPSDGRMHKVTHGEFKKIWTGVLILVEPKETFKAGKIGNSNVKKFYDLAKPYKSVMV